MPRQELNTQGGKSLAKQLRPRGKRTGSGQVDSLWRGSETVLLQYVVAAGGGGGAAWAGGGGAGGYRSSIPGESSGGGASAEEPLTVEKGEALVLTVGAGGATNSAGSNSVFHAITSLGGGVTGGNGGSGGGGGTAGAGTAGQGYAGGTGTNTTDCNGNGRIPGGGGGGAGGVGESSFVSGGWQYSGQGGIGVQTFATGSSILLCAGGNAGARSHTSDNQGCNYRRTRGWGEGTGGHEGHGDCGGRSVGTAAGANTGGGSGGIPYAYDPGNTYNGGSGRVIVRWVTGTATPSVSAGITYTSGTTGIYSFINCTAGTGTVTFS